MTPSKAKDLSTNMLLAAYGRDEADKMLITTAVGNIYLMGIAHGMTIALDQVKEMQREAIL